MRRGMISVRRDEHELGQAAGSNAMQRLVPRFWQILFALILGAAVNVGIAWWIAVATRPPIRWHVPTGSVSYNGPWIGRVPSDWPGFVATAPGEKCVSFGSATDHFALGYTKREIRASGSYGIYSMDVHDVGWPLRSLRRVEQDVYLNHVTLRGGGPCPQVKWWGGVTMMGWADKSRQGPGFNDSVVFPLIPLPLGFVVNTAVYSAMCLLLVAIAGAGRTRLRVRRGECGACRYPVGGLRTCPECGTSCPQSGAVNGASAV
jgi:hypothetical protein